MDGVLNLIIPYLGIFCIMLNNSLTVYFWTKQCSYIIYEIVPKEQNHLYVSIPVAMETPKSPWQPGFFDNSKTEAVRAKLY